MLLFCIPEFNSPIYVDRYPLGLYIALDTLSKLTPLGEISRSHSDVTFRCMTLTLFQKERWSLTSFDIYTAVRYTISLLKDFVLLSSVNVSFLCLFMELACYCAWGIRFIPCSHFICVETLFLKKLVRGDVWQKF